MAIGAVIFNANKCPWNFPHQSEIHVNPAKLRVKIAVRCNVSDHNTRLQNLALQEATHAAALRFQESQQPEPLFHDPYARCFIDSDLYGGISSNFEYTMTSSLSYYRLATKFIDDKLLDAVNKHDAPRQIVLLTDGMDTRPFRLKWPPISIIFDISFDAVFQIAANKLNEVGARTSRSSLFRHIPAELSELQERLRNLGYKGDKPSIWAVQGFYPMTSDRLGEILYQISCLAMKGSHFVGELPLVAVEPDSTSEEHEGKWIEKAFKRNGFSVDIVSYAKVASDLCEKCLIDDASLVMADDGGKCRSVLFVAQQQRLSDDQLDFVRREMELAEESGDEEGFEDM